MLVGCFSVRRDVPAVRVVLVCRANANDVSFRARAIIYRSERETDPRQWGSARRAYGPPANVPLRDDDDGRSGHANGPLSRGRRAADKDGSARAVTTPRYTDEDARREVVSSRTPFPS